jgi:HrpA-like RNA helicase
MEAHIESKLHPNIPYYVIQKYYIIYMPNNDDKMDTPNTITEFVNEINRNKLNNSVKNRNTFVNPKDLFREIGILDPQGLQLNPLTGEVYEDIYYNSSKNVGEDNVTYKFLSGFWSNMPMYTKRIESIKAIYENQVVLIISGTGSGKTVLTPKFALHALNYQGRIAITNPKRIPSKENAIYAAKTLGVKLGKQVGLKYRGSDSSHYSANDAKLIYCTDGYIVAKLESDPMLSDFDCLIIDEAHERNVNIDLLLLLLKGLIKRRPDFKLIIMSATINEKTFINYFPQPEFKFAFIDAGSIPNKHIDEYFLDTPINKFDQNGNLINKDFIQAGVDRVVKILRETPEGDILVFFTGKGEAQDGMTLLHRELERVNKNLDSKIYADILHAGTRKEAQDLLIDNKQYKKNTKFTRKVIFATEVAESSITIKALDYVIDSGLANQNIYYGAKNMVSLEKKYIAKANHRQRKGRVGRKRPGFCYNLFTKKEYEEKFPEYPDAPILTEDISSNVLLFLSNKELVTHINYPFTYPVVAANRSIKGGKEPVRTLKPSILRDSKIENNSVAVMNKATNKAMTNIPVTIVNKAALMAANKTVIKAVNKPAAPSSLGLGTDLATFLATMIEKPPIDNIKRILDRIEALGGIKITNNRGEFTDMGRAMAVFGFTPEIGKMIISGYNYHCRDEVANIAAIFEVSEMRMDTIFERFSSRSKDESQKKLEKQKYDKVKKKFASAMGDHISLVNIYRDFFERRYDTTNRRTGAVLKEKRGDAKEWCKENFLNYNRLDKVRDTAKQINRRFGRVIQIYRETHPENKPSHIFVNSPPVVSDKKDENILMAVIQGFYVNLMRKVGDRRYVNCFPPDKTTAMLAMDSLYGSIRATTNFAVYSELKSIFGRTGYAFVSKVPPSMIENLKKLEIGKKFESCFGEIKVMKSPQFKDRKGKKQGKQGKKGHHRR